jgi:hypothetical protein
MLYHIHLRPYSARCHVIMSTDSINSLTTAITALTSRLDELDASQIPYDGTVSGLNATNVQAAINIVAKNGSQIVFLRGWLNRVLKLKEEW